MKKICFGFFITLYIIISLIVTTCLLHYNDYNITVINGKSLISLKSDYDDFYIASKDEAFEQIETAEMIINAVEVYLTSKNKSDSI